LAFLPGLQGEAVSQYFGQFGAVLTSSFFQQLWGLCWSVGLDSTHSSVIFRWAWSHSVCHCGLLLVLRKKQTLAGCSISSWNGPLKYALQTKLPLTLIKQDCSDCSAAGTYSWGRQPPLFGYACTNKIMLEKVLAFVNYILKSLATTGCSFGQGRLGLFQRIHGTVWGVRTGQGPGSILVAATVMETNRSWYNRCELFCASWP